MDRFTAMTVFVRVARTGSFSATAQEMGVQQSTVSKHVAALEQHLGVQLLTRTTRHVGLTEAGMNFFEQCSRILNDLEIAEQEAGKLRYSPTGTLRVSAPVAFGRQHVVPHVISFAKRHPQMKLELSMSDRFVDLVEEGVDVAIRVGQLTGMSIVARKIGYSRRILIASSDYLERHGTPTHPRHLADHNCIVYSLLSTRNVWSFNGPDGQEGVKVGGSLVINNPDAIRDAVMAGIGIGVVGVYAVKDEIERGDVKVLMPRYEPPPMAINAVYASTRHVSMKVRHFIDFYRDALRATRLFE